jgi:hypothetical protein
VPPSGKSTPPQRWSGLVSASLDALREDAGTPIAAPPSGASEAPEVDDLIAKAAVALEGHASAAQAARTRMARLSADAAASLRSAIEGESPSGTERSARGATSGTRLDVQR